jgi:hypothetical protein
MRSRVRVLTLAAALGLACEASTAPAPAVSENPSRAGLVPERARGAATQPPRPADAGTPADRDAPGATFPGDYCAAAGADGFDQIQSAVEIVDDYEAAWRGECATSGLLPTLTQRQANDWRDYLVGFTLAMAGCPLLLGPVDGGTLVFGLTHTVAIGLPPVRFGREDARRLIAHYVASFAAVLRLSSAEASAVEGRLWSSAEKELDTSDDEALSTCPDAGQ